MQPTDNNSILQAIQQLANTSATQIPINAVPTLQYTAPNISDISSKYQEFLNRAAKDPDIVNYYNQLLNTAVGDTNLAEQYLESDYQTGVRNTLDNLHGSLAQLGFTNQQNQTSQQDSLNKRGIALTQGADGKLSYAGGGEAQTEVGNTNTQYALQQEAQKRSASQTVTNAAQTLQQGISKAGQSLAQTTQQYQGQQNTDIANRANTYMGLYNEQQQAAANAAAQKAQKAALAGPAPANPRPGQTVLVDTRQNGYRWNGNSWEIVQ